MITFKDISFCCGYLINFFCEPFLDFIFCLNVLTLVDFELLVVLLQFMKLFLPFFLKDFYPIFKCLLDCLEIHRYDIFITLL